MSTFGRILKVTTYGESHSNCRFVFNQRFKQQDVQLKGFQQTFSSISQFSLCQYQNPKEQLQRYLDRRKPGQSSLTTARKEQDKLIIQSDIPRPGHADYTYQEKYNIRAESGGGRSSARETIGRVGAGALAEQYLKKKYNIEIYSFVSSVGSVMLAEEEKWKYVELEGLNKEKVDEMSTFQVYKRQTLEEPGELFLVNKNTLNWYKLDNNKCDLQQTVEQPTENLQLFDTVTIRCPCELKAVKMIQQIQIVRAQRDSIGGIITCCIKNLPVGLGEPVFDKLPAVLAHGMLSIPAVKGFEIGSGFKGTTMNGSQHNDCFSFDEIKHRLIKQSNNSGGTLGGISDGSTVYFSVAFKPVSTIGKTQITCDFQGKEAVLESKGRHDPCVLPRAPPIVEAMSAICILDLILIQKALSE